MPKGKNSTIGSQRLIDFFPNPDMKKIHNGTLTQTECPVLTQSHVGTDLAATAEAPADPISPVKYLPCSFATAIPLQQRT